MLDIVRTERLNIKSWSEEFAEDFFELTQDDGFNAFPITIYRQKSIDTSREWIRNEMELHRKTGLGKVGLWVKATDSLVGMGGLTSWEWENEQLVDLTYRLRRGAWGNGYGRETAFALTTHAFRSLKLKEITATITPDNLPSIKIVNELGMKFQKRIILKNVETDLYRLPARHFTVSLA